MKKGNKGEWSEFYAFLKILADGKLFAADKDLQKITEKYFNVLKIVREEAQTGEKTYDLMESQGEILIFNKNNKEIDTVNRSSISKKVEKIFEKIIATTESTFAIPLADEVMKDLHCTQIKAASMKKADLFLKIYDRISPTTPNLGFSIKSMLGAPSTLLNPSSHTNFVYKISKKVNADEINSIKSSSKIRDRIKKIEESGATMEYDHMDSSEFEKNLRMIDTMFPQMMALALKAFFESHGKTLAEIADYLDVNRIIQKKFSLSQADYTYKIKHFLMSVALGMTPKGDWDGLTEAHGGYIIVREDGEVVCYHLYNRDQFQEYLFENTKLDTPSSSRYKFGTVYEKNSRQFIKLNLQIRFLK
jgi:hypothetical protein